MQEWDIGRRAKRPRGTAGEVPAEAPGELGKDFIGIEVGSQTNFPPKDFALELQEVKSQLAAAKLRSLWWFAKYVALKRRFDGESESDEDQMNEVGDSVHEQEVDDDGSGDSSETVDLNSPVGIF